MSDLGIGIPPGFGTGFTLPKGIGSTAPPPPKSTDVGLGIQPGFGTPFTLPPAPAGVTASSAHNMLKAVAFELAFVVVATMLAGISDSWGSGMVTLMLALLILRGLFEVDLFAAFAKGLQFHP